MNSIKQTWGDKVEKANKNIENSEAIEDLNKIENIAFIDINGTKISIELLESQKYENVEAIPIKSDFFGKKDFLTLKKGYEMNLVEIKELEHSTVNTVLCKNDSVTPLILIDGDEITGAMQNRIINDTLLFQPNQQSTFLSAALNMEDGTLKEKVRNQEPSSHHCTLQITVQEAENQELPMKNVTIKVKYGIPLVNLNQDQISNQ